MKSKTISYHGLEVDVRYELPTRATHTDPADSGELIIDEVAFDDLSEWDEHHRDADGKTLFSVKEAADWLRSRPSEMDALWRKVVA